MSPNESKVALGMWKQLGDKFQALKVETRKWMDLLGTLTAHVSSFSAKITEAAAQWNQSLSE